MDTGRSGIINEEKNGETTSHPFDTERMTFGVWKEHNKEDFVTLYSNHQVTALIGGPFSDEQINSRFMKEIRSYQDYGIQYYPLYLKETKELIGCCGLQYYKTNNDLLIYELGFHLLPHHWGRGYATEAAKVMCTYAFEDLCVDALFAGHNPNNVNSKKCLEKLGFVFYNEEFYEPTGLLHPSYILYRDDWKNSK